MSMAGSYPGCPPFSLTQRSHLEQDLREGRIPSNSGFALVNRVGCPCNDPSPAYVRRMFMALHLDAAKKRLLSVEEAAQYLGVQRRTIRSWAFQERIPSVHIGRRLLFDQEELDRMIEACKRPTR